MRIGLALLSTLIFFRATALLCAETNQIFDGRPWNISSGNFSVSYIQRSPIGAFPETNFVEAPPSVESQIHLKNLGLVANEDYVAWGAIEREPGKWNWKQHDAIEQTLHKAGLNYVVYNWVHFPPRWLRDQKSERTLMRCLEHGEETFYLSIFDPRTIQWYDHFYKNLHQHFGARIDSVYACILGPYAEGNYPMEVTAHVNMGHCHEGYWCGDAFAIKAFRVAMGKKYRRVTNLNRAWGVNCKSFDEVRPPEELSSATLKPSLAAFSTPQARRRWLDFISWYHQAIIDFSGQSLKTVLKYFPAEKVRMKPGGNYGSVNPLAWGTYCPGYAKMAKGSGVVLQPADAQGAIFADKWIGTAYQFYGVKESTEQAGDLLERAFMQRMFSDAACGVSQLFTYDYARYASNVQKYIHLYTGKPGETEIALYCPTTLYRLGVNLHPTIVASYPLRDLCDYDVLDELLIADGALTTKRYKALVLFQAEIIDQAILKKIDAFRRAGGKIIIAGDDEIKNVEGERWAGANKSIHVSSLSKNEEWPKEIVAKLSRYKGFEGQLDGVWTSCRGKQTFVFNSTDKSVTKTISGQLATVPPYSIWFSPPQNRK
ncbi:MAG: family 14 glycosylhydrolase [Verrucomicrobiota bacterium]